MNPGPGLCIGMVMGVLVAGGARADEPPPIFAKLTFAQAVEKNKNSGKVLVVKATASWCGPCKMMDRTTWRDDKVVKWFDANGTAIQFDVDQESALAQKLKIQAMPTMVAFVKGQEFDRVVGYKKPEDLLGWVEGVKRGEKSSTATLKRLEGARAGGAKMGMQERLQAAQELAQVGEHEKATDEFVWLWHNMVAQEPAMSGVRGSFMASYMTQLAAAFGPARERFAAMRDEAEARLKGEDKTWQDLDDWIVLNEVVGQQDRTLEWFDRLKNDPESRATLDRQSFRLQKLLEERERWADSVIFVRDPGAKLRGAHAQMQMMLRMADSPQMEGQRDEVLQTGREMFRDSAGRLYAGLLAAGRDEEAGKVREQAVKLDDSGPMRAALVKWALKAGQARPDQTTLLDEADRAGDAPDADALRDQLAGALKPSR